MTDEEERELVRGRLMRMGTNGPEQLLADVTGDVMEVHEAGVSRVREIHQEQGIAPEVTARMVARMSALVDTAPPSPGEARSPLIIANRPSGLMWAVTPGDQ